MNRNGTLALVSGAVGLAAVATVPLLAGAARLDLGSATTSTTVTATTAAGPFVLPEGFSYLVDDTNRITVAVPTAWSDVTTSSTTSEGAVVPAISAAPNLDAMDDTFTTAGVRYAALPFTADLAALLDRAGDGSGCATSTDVSYADGVFTGLWRQWTGCGASGQGALHVIAASPAGDPFTAFVAVQLAGPQDQQAFDVVLETFNVTASATWPASTPAPSTTVVPTTLVPSTTAVPSTTQTPASTIPVVTTVVPPPTAPASTMVVPTTGLPTIGDRLVDSTGFLTVTVPANWSDQSVTSSRRDDGSDRPMIIAAPDIDDYLAGSQGSGTRVYALPATTEPAALLDRFAYSASCTDGGITQFDDGRFAGQRQSWVDCDGSTTRLVNVAGRSIDGSITMFVQVQQTIPDDVVVNSILTSAGIVPGAVYPTPDPAEPLVPVGSVPAELLTAPTIALSEVADVTGALALSVPSDWTDTEDRPQMNDDATDRPRLAAAPDLDEFYVNWAAPGLQAIAYPFTADPSTLLINHSFADSCTDAGVQSFDDGSFSGLMQTWTSCGDADSRNVVLALSPPDQSATVYLEVQLPDADNTPLQAVLSSLRLA